MITTFVRRPRPITWMVLVSMLILVFALSACGSDTGGSTGTATTVNIKESKGASGGDVYACDPTTLTVKKGDSVTFTNMTDEKQTFDQGDAQKAGINLSLDLNGSSPIIFNTTGTFALKSGKGATITVMVQ